MQTNAHTHINTSLSNWLVSFGHHQILHRSCIFPQNLPKCFVSSSLRAVHVVSDIGWFCFLCWLESDNNYEFFKYEWWTNNFYYLSDEGRWLSRRREKEMWNGFGEYIEIHSFGMCLRQQNQSNHQHINSLLLISFGFFLLRISLFRRSISTKTHLTRLDLSMCQSRAIFIGQRLEW